MKKIILFLPLAALSASAALAATVTVLVQQATVRKKPQFFASPAGTVRLGQKLSAEGPVDGWYKVSGGYLQQSAVTAKTVRLGSGSSVGGSATADEVTLAGKGFNSQIEKSYGDKNASLNFTAVDAMERRSVSDEDVLDFMRAGGLLPEGGSR